VKDRNHLAEVKTTNKVEIITKGVVRNIESNGVKINFLSKKNILDIPTEKIKTKTGYMNISTKETTVFDIVKYIESSGYLDNAVNIIIEISKNLRARNLGVVAKVYETTILQRVGYLLDNFSKAESLSRFIYEEIQKRGPQIIPLSIYSKKVDGTIDEKWKIRINEIVDADVCCPMAK
jgi:predicted transcriptional regulator of viral defense system